MEVINQRAALLSNYEVLMLLKELESDHLARAKTAIRIKKEEEAAGLTPKHQPPTDVICENLRTVEVEAIQYLSADYQPTGSQSPEGIAQLTKNLARWSLTKAEKLQIVNLAPTEPVELYVIVEEMEDRFGEQMDDILNAVKETIHEVASVNGDSKGAEPVPAMQVDTAVYSEYQEDYQVEQWNYNADEVIFDDTGEGAGVEGDLDVDDE